MSRNNKELVNTLNEFNSTKWSSSSFYKSLNDSLFDTEMDTHDISDELKIEHELGKIINEEYILNTIENFQDMDEDEEWTLLVDSSTSAWWMSNQGTYIDSKLPFFHIQIDFEKKYNFIDIVEAVFEPEQRQKWDKDIKEIVSKPNQLGSMSIVYTTYKPYKVIGSAVLMEKQLTFTTENENGMKIFVSYTSSLPEKISPGSSEYSMVKTLFWITTIEQQNDGSVILQTYMQIDTGFKLQLQSFRNEVSAFGWHECLLKASVWSC